MTPFIQKSVTLHADPKRIWRALTNEKDLAKWWSDGVVIQPEAGGLFKEPWTDSEGQAQLATGKVLNAIDEKELKFTWHERDWPENWETECTIKIEDEGDDRILTVTHDGWEHLPEEKREALLQDFEIGWGLHLKELKSFVDLSP